MAICGSCTDRSGHRLPILNLTVNHLRRRIRITPLARRQARHTAILLTQSRFGISSFLRQWLRLVIIHLLRTDPGLQRRGRASSHTQSSRVSQRIHLTSGSSPTFSRSNSAVRRRHQYGARPWKSSMERVDAAGLIFVLALKLFDIGGPLRG